LFTRDARAVRLTEPGQRFLAPARRALAEADRAVEAARDPGRPLRGLDHLIRGVRADRRRFSLLPAEIALPGDAGVRSVPLAGPTPLYAWSLVWLSQDRHPQLRTLLRRFAETGLRRRWLEYDAARDWLPAHDQAELRRLEHMTAHPGT
jgi:DNA-binding transcriptional LysR family regulator